MKKILYSASAIAVVAALVAVGTGAFYGDTETSTGNTFTAGAIELKVDSQSHYNGMVCTDGVWLPEDTGSSTYPELLGEKCDGTWSETDLKDGVHTFFNFTDLKPGDNGENTISLHVYDNDAWGQFVISNIVDSDNGCTEPEQVAEDGTCGTDGTGEIDENLRFTGWLDQGSIPGFQNIGPDGQPFDGTPVDLLEGNNELDDGEPVFWENTLIGDLGPFELSDLFREVYSSYCTGDSANPTGHNEYKYCQGLAEDGRMVGSTTYYFGLAWDLDLQGTGNEVQTDSYVADLTFRVEQRRNNPDPFTPIPD